MKRLLIIISAVSISGLNTAHAAVPYAAQTSNATCPQQGAYWKQQTETYYRYAHGYASQLTNLLKELGASDTNHALSIIASLQKEAAAPQAPVQPMQVEKAEVEELLDILAAQHEQEAINNILALQQLAQEGLANVFTSIAGAVNSVSLKAKLDAIKAAGLDQFDEQEVVAALNQAQYNAIFGLKKKYFDALHTLTTFVNPQLMQLNALIKAKKNRVSHQALLSLIPDAPTQLPKKFEGSVKDLVDLVQKLEIE